MTQAYCKKKFTKIKKTTLHNNRSVFPLPSRVELWPSLAVISICLLYVNSHMYTCMELSFLLSVIGF